MIPNQPYQRSKPAADGLVYWRIRIFGATQVPRIKAQPASAVDKETGQTLKNERGLSNLKCKMTLEFSVLVGGS